MLKTYSNEEYDDDFYLESDKYSCVLTEQPDIQPDDTSELDEESEGDTKSDTAIEDHYLEW